MKKTLAAAALLLALAGLTGCTNDVNPARITGPSSPVAKVAEATQAPKPEVQPTKAAELVPVAEPVAVAPVEVVPAPVKPAVIDWAADARSVFSGGVYLGTWSDKVHFGTAPGVEVVPSQAHPGFFHFFAVSKPEVAKTVTCEEDQPCWDCKTMGNKICGPAKSTCESRGLITAEDYSCVPPSFYAGQGAQMGNAGKDAPVGTPPAGVTVSPVYGNPPYTAGNCPPGMRNMSEAGCPAEAVDTCEQDLADLLGADASVTDKNVTGMVWDGKNCTISVSN